MSPVTFFILQIAGQTPGAHFAIALFVFIILHSLYLEYGSAFAPSLSE